MQNNPINVVDPNGLESTRIRDVSGSTVSRSSSTRLTRSQRRLLRTRTEDARTTLTRELGRTYRRLFGEGELVWHQTQRRWVWDPINQPESGDGTGDGAGEGDSSGGSDSASDSGEGGNGERSEGTAGGSDTGSDSNVEGNGESAGAGDTTGNNVNNGDGDQGTQTSTGDGVNTGDGGSGTEGTGGTGSGLGQQGTGRGGGGTTDSATGSGTVNGSGSGTGSGFGAGTARGVGGSRTGRTGAGRPGGSGSGTSENGQRGGQVGGSSDGVLGGQLGGDDRGSLDGNIDGEPDGVTNGTLEGGGSRENLTGNQSGNGAPEASQVTGQNAGEQPTGTNNSRQGNEGQQGQAGDPRTNWLDTATRWTGYLNLAFGGDEEGGEAGGIPGGLDLFGWRPPMWVRRTLQVVYIAATIVTTIIPIGKVALAFKVAIQGAFKLGLRAAARQLLTRIAARIPSRAAIASTLSRAKNSIKNIVEKISLGERGRRLWSRTLRSGSERFFSTTWGNVRTRLNRIVHGRPTNPNILDSVSGMVKGEWHHGVMSQRMARSLSNLLRPISTRASQAIERFAHGNVKLLSPRMHQMADRFAHRGFNLPWWSRGAFNPVKTWIGLTPFQRVWGSAAVGATGYGSYQVGSSISSAITD